MTVTTNDLTGIGEHFVYEWSMLFHTAALLAEWDGKVPNDPRSKGTCSACVESFAVHVRNLCEFFVFTGDGDPEDRNCRAYHFFGPAPESWKAARGDVSNLLGLHKKACEQVTHLTYHRNWMRPEQKAWPVREILQSFDEMMERLRSTAFSAGKAELVQLIDRARKAQPFLLNKPGPSDTRESRPSSPTPVQLPGGILLGSTTVPSTTDPPGVYQVPSPSMRAKTTPPDQDDGDHVTSYQ